MAKYRISSPEGQAYDIEAPDDATPDQVQAVAAQHIASLTQPAPAAAPAPPNDPGMLVGSAAGIARGFSRMPGNIGGAIASLFPSVDLYKRQRQQFDQSMQSLDKTGGDALSYKVGDVAGQVASTLPVGGVVAAPVKALANAGVATKVLAPLAEAIATGGSRAGGLAGAAGLGARTAGGAINGAASAAAVNPDDAGIGAVVGGLLPGAAGLVKRGAQGVGSVFRPFFQGGQENIVGSALRQFATDPVAARQAMANTAEVIPGSAPTAVAASGDIGLAGLSRTLQSTSPAYAAELASRQGAQNAARTAALEAVAGNVGKISTAKEARDAATAAMRDSALEAAGQVPGNALLSRLDSMMGRPDNAGRLVQQALGGIRNQVAGLVDKAGNIDARALYAVRKDINDILGGKLQGEAGNLKFASGQLIGVKDAIDNIIEMAGRRVPMSSGRDVVPLGGALAPPGPVSAGPARTGWKDYLQEYARQSVPINQMERLQEVLQRIQTGSVDSQGSLVLSAAKLNNLLKNEGQDLIKELAPEQLDLLRRLASDLNAGQLAQTAGRSVGSDTVQKLGSNNILQASLGSKIGGSTPARSTLGRLLELPYGRSDKQMVEMMGQAMLDPTMAARLMSDPKTAKALALFSQSSLPRLAYQAGPLLGAQGPAAGQ